MARDNPNVTLRKILEHEQRLGCKDDAVGGGLEAFVAKWAAREQESLTPEGVEALADLVAGYRTLPSQDRHARLVTALRLLTGLGAQDVDQRSPERQADEERSTPVFVTTSLPDPATNEKTRKARTHVHDGQVPKIVAKRQEPLPQPSARARNGRQPVFDKAAHTANYPQIVGALDVPVTRLPGISSGYARHLQRLGIATVRDLLYHFPRRHVDYRNTKPIKDLSPGETESVLATIWEVHVRRARSGLTIIEMVCGDETGMAGAVWFNQPYLPKSLAQNRQVVLSGRVEIGPRGEPYFKSPDWELIGDEELVHAGRLVPVHPLTEGISGRWLRRLIKTTIDRRIGELVDHLPPRVRLEEGLLDLATAVEQMHFPDSELLKERAERRLAFDELFLIQLGVLGRRRAWSEGSAGHSFVVDHPTVEAFLATLPFQLTVGQQRSVDEILLDMSAPRAMTRLLQGDVGSGKTVVAAIAMLVVARAGWQSVLMAPTEILAEQHFRTLSQLLGAVPRSHVSSPSPDSGLRVRLLTGSMRKREKDALYAEVAAGDVDVLVGTSAVIQEGVDVARLGLAVIDEQHRFGVIQRAALRQKGYNPDLLVMTATPIPRTLALTLYGDLDISTIRELPPGRPSLRTVVLGPDQRQIAYDFLRQHVAIGEQAFVVCPLVEESDKIEAKAATAEYERLRRDVFPDLRLGLLHGRMAARDKDAVMRAFRAGGQDVLVSTAVVEVGIDVPNATVMMIEGADRFGLAQLHQFRGRVGLGTAESYCILLSDSPTVEAEERLRVLARTRDGAVLAEEDLKLRGPGEFFGTRQHGLPEVRVANLGDIAGLEAARKAAQRLIERDPQLGAPEHRLLAAKVASFWSGNSDVS